MAVSDRKSTSLKVLLLALLLAVQALGHAHAIEHNLDGDNSLCSICSVTGHNGAVSSDCCETAVEIPLQQTVSSRQDRAVLPACDRLPDARAPPLS